MNVEPRPPTAVRLLVPAGDAEVVTDLLWQLGTTGVAEVETGSGVELTAGFGGPPPHAELERLGLTVEELELFDWAAMWAEHAAAVQAGPFTVTPPLIDAGPGELVLVIDPGESFGHGGHPTTRLVLEQLPMVVRPGHSVLDLGSGSGVLSIAAARLGARVTAADIDAEARRATQANAELNGVSLDGISPDIGALRGPFDIVLVNVTVDVQEHLAPDVERLAGAGTIVLSGFLAGQVDRVLGRHAERTLHRRIDDDGWVALVLS